MPQSISIILAILGAILVILSIIGGDISWSGNIIIAKRSLSEKFIAATAGILFISGAILLDRSKSQTSLNTATPTLINASSVSQNVVTETPVITSNPTLNSTNSPPVISNLSPSPTDMIILQPTATNTPEPTATNTPEPTATLLPFSFIDEFTDILKPDWKIFEDGLSISSGTLYGKEGLVFLPLNISNYHIKTSIRGSKFKIIFRATVIDGNIDTGYAFSCGIESCVWQIYEYGNFTDISIPYTRDEFFPYDDEYHDLQISISGRNFSAKSNENNLTAVANERFTTGGVGLEAYGRLPPYTDGTSYRAFFDRFELIQITP